MDQKQGRKSREYGKKITFSISCLVISVVWSLFMLHRCAAFYPLSLSLLIFFLLFQHFILVGHVSSFLLPKYLFQCFFSHNYIVKLCCIVSLFSLLPGPSLPSCLPLLFLLPYLCSDIHQCYSGMYWLGTMWTISVFLLLPCYPTLWLSEEPTEGTYTRKRGAKQVHVSLLVLLGLCCSPSVH